MTVRGMTRGMARLAGTCAIAGSALLLVGTWLHPMSADPNDAVAAFTEYAADRIWVASHLLQLAGVTGMAAALLVVTREIDRRSDAAWARLAAAGAAASLAIAAALQAVDGVALKRMVDAWAAAPAATQDAAFRAAFAVRQIEVGLASMLSMGLGLAVTVFGVALLADGEPRWRGALAVVGGAPSTVAGVVMAYQGFSDLAMTINLLAGSLLLLWMAALGVVLWRR